MQKHKVANFSKISLVLLFGVIFRSTNSYGYQKHYPDFYFSIVKATLRQDSGFPHSPWIIRGIDILKVEKFWKNFGIGVSLLESNFNYQVLSGEFAVESETGGVQIYTWGVAQCAKFSVLPLTGRYIICSKRIGIGTVNPYIACNISYLNFPTLIDIIPIWLPGVPFSWWTEYAIVFPSYSIDLNVGCFVNQALPFNLQFGVYFTRFPRVKWIDPIIAQHAEISSYRYSLYIAVGIALGMFSTKIREMGGKNGD